MTVVTEHLALGKLLDSPRIVECHTPKLSGSNLFSRWVNMIEFEVIYASTPHALLASEELGSTLGFSLALPGLYHDGIISYLTGGFVMPYSRRMIFNLQPCHMIQTALDKDGQQYCSAQCAVHDWDVHRTFDRGDRDAVRWAVDESRQHEALFRRIAVARARSQVALDAQLQRLLDQDVLWLSREAFDGDFLRGIGLIQITLPPEE